MTGFYKILGILMALMTSTVVAQFRFDYSYNIKAGGWLKLHVMPSTFQDAFKRCHAEGAVLASPLNAYLRNAMVSLHKKAINQNTGLFTGIHSIVTKAAFMSVEGVPLNKIPLTWAPDEPDNHKNEEDCIVMLANGTVADVRCSETFPFVCYKKKTKNLVLNDCGTVDNEYTMDARTGSCYKFHRIGRSWRNAYMTCVAEGGHLAIVNSAAEATAIGDVFQRYSAKVIFSSFKDIAFVGYYDWGEHGSFYTVQGETLDEAGYSRWGEGNPDNAKGEDGPFVCGGMTRDGRYYDMWCNKDIAPFICEKKPDSLLADDEYS